METDRCSQTKEESGDIIEVIVIPDDPPSPQDIAGSSVSFSSSHAVASLRVADTTQSPSVDLVTRPDSTDCHLTSGVNRPPQPPMENQRIMRRETQTAGESTVNASTSLCRPYNVPATSAFHLSQATCAQQAESTTSVPFESPASLPASEDCYSNNPLTKPFQAGEVQTGSGKVSKRKKGKTPRNRKRKRTEAPSYRKEDLKQPKVTSSNAAGERKRELSPGCSNQDPKQPKVTSMDMAVKQGIPTDDDLEKVGKEIAEKWMQLGRRLGVKEPELKDIDQRQRQLCEKGYYMLMAWREKEGFAATYEILNAALQHEHLQRRDIAEQICYNHDVPIAGPFDVKLCRRKLAEHYKRTATVPTSVWSKTSAVNIQQIYTRLSWVKEEQTPAGSSRAELNHYTDVLRAENKNRLPSNRILVHGQTGIGKSTFVKKLAMDWAELDGNGLTDEQRVILKKFELAVIIDLKKVSKHQSLRDVISASHIFAEEDAAMKDGLLSYITQNQDKVLLVFDGYDEYHFGSNSEIFEIFKGNKLRNCCVLITTRISKADELKEFKNAHAEITGFSKKDRRDYIARFFGDVRQVRALLYHLKERDLEDLARVPLLLLFFCTLWKNRKSQSFPDSKTKLYFAIVQHLLYHYEAKSSPSNFRVVEDFADILAEIGKVALECLLKDDHVFEFGQLSATILREEIRIIGLLQVSEYTENLRPAEMVSFIHKSIQEFLAAWYITYRCVPEGNLGEINNSAQTLDDCSSLENVFQFVCGLSDDGAGKVFEHLTSVRKSDPELDLSKTIPGGTDKPPCDVTARQMSFIYLVEISFSEVQSKTEYLNHYLNCTDGIIFLTSGSSVSEIVPERKNLNGIALRGVVCFGGYLIVFSKPKIRAIYESIEFLNCLDVPLRMTKNSVVVSVGQFLRKFEASSCDKCYFNCILCFHHGEPLFYITKLKLWCYDHVGIFDVTDMDSTPPFSTSLSSEEFCLKFLTFLSIGVSVNEQTVKYFSSFVGDCKNLKIIRFIDVTSSTCEFLKYVPNPRTCQVELGTSFFDCPNYEQQSLTSADVMKLAGFLPQFNNLIVLGLKLSDCCAKAVNKLVSSITHETLEALALVDIRLTTEAAAELCRSLSEMSSLRVFLIGLNENIQDTNEIGALPTDETSLILHLFKFSYSSAKVYRFFPNLEEIDLGRLNLNERDLLELLENLKLIPKLRFLLLNGNHLGANDRVHSMVKQELPQVDLGYN